MPDYRVYLLDVRQKILSGDWLSASDDDAAARAARALFVPGVPTIEVWRGTQRVAVLEAGASPDAEA